MNVCVFCQIVEGSEPARFIAQWNDAVAIEPLDPVVEGHLLVIPVEHVADFGEDPWVSAVAMYRAAQLVGDHSLDINLITSRGRWATQSVFHLHLHLVPREEGDGLKLPWSRQ